MKKLGYILCLLLAFNAIKAQTFTVIHTDTIPDNNTTVSFDVLVSGLPAVIDTNFGLELACLNMYHTYCSDMEVQLQAPDGTIILLFSGVGGGDDNFFNTCLAGTGTSITQGNAPFTGTFQSQGTMGNVNNGQNPNGIWHLLCRDMAGADIGILTQWSITFGNNPAMPFIFSSSNLPIVKLTTLGAPISNDPKVPVRMQIIDNGTGIRNYSNQTNYAYDGTIMAEWQGFTGPYYPKKNYDFETVDAQGLELDTTILGMPREHDWIFKAEYLDHTLVKNMVTYEMARRMGNYAPRTRMCEIILDGDYIGYYTLTEKVKRDSNRVDIAKLTPADISGQALTGGYIIEMNITGDPGDWYSQYPSINTGGAVEFKHVYPRSVNIMPAQAAYIHAYVDSFENALNGPNFAHPTLGYRRYADIATFIDFLIVNEYSVNYDSYGRSTFMYKEKITDGGKLKIDPPWDYDRAYEYTNPGITNGWVWQITHPGWPFPFWWSKWWTEQDYRKQLACRWTMLRQTTLSTDSFMVFIDSLTARIDEAQGRNFTVWNDLGGQTYQDQVDSLRSFLTRRLNWIDGQLAMENVAPPVFYLPTDTLLCAGTVYDAGFNGNQFSYNWQPGPDTSAIMLDTAGTYTLKVTDRWGCYARKTMDVTISIPNADFTSSQTGPGLTTTFTPVNPNGTSYFWYFGDGSSSTSITPAHTYSAVGQYVVTLLVTDTIGCVTSLSDTIHVDLVGVDGSVGFGGEAYPNPFSDRLNVDFGRVTLTETRIELQNELGQRVLSEVFAPGVRVVGLRTKELPAGVYFLGVSDGEHRMVRKVVKW